jgi:two-component system response regulator FixJ
VLDRVVAGRSSKEIAAELGSSPRTVDVYRDHLREKLGAKNVADLVRRALSEPPRA